MGLRTVIIALLLLLSVSKAAKAEDAAGEKAEEAVALGREGLNLFARGEWKAAAEWFAAAERLAHSPVFLLYIARCQQNSGDWVSAQGSFELLARESVSDSAPAAFRRAISDARAEHAALLERMPTIIIELRHEPQEAQELRVTLDGVPLALENLQRETAINPGPHTVVVMMAGKRQALERFDIVPGEKRKLIQPRIASRSAHADAPSTPAKRAAPPKRETPKRETTNSWNPAVITAFGVGAAGIVTGATTGILAWIETDSFKDQCTGNSCPREVSSDLERAENLGAVSTIGFIVGGVGVATGTALLFFQSKTQRSTANVGLMLSPTRIDVTAQF